MKIEKAVDVVVIGSGGGGLRAAISAASSGKDTLVICRGSAKRSGATLLAGANISADVACDGATLARLGISSKLEDDTPEKWFEEVVREGFYLNNQDMLTMFTETAGERVSELVEWGLKVRGMEGEREISVFGSDIIDTLYGKATKEGARFLENTMFLDLVIKDGQASGVICLDLLSGELLAIPAKAVVLCTGGAHNVFAENSGSTDLCGEGQGAAIRAGAELIDMEMISYCPTVTKYPDMYQGNILPYIFITTGYGTLLNKYGKTFVQRYLSPKAEKLALESEWNKMLLSYAVQSEILAEKGTRHGGVYFSLPNHPKEIVEEMYHDLPSLKKGIYGDIMSIFASGSSFVVQPAAHYFEGGIRIDRTGKSSIPGLFAAGECTGGLFGANRVSAATTEMLVEGAQAGCSAGAYAKERQMPTLEPSDLSMLEAEILAPFGRKEGVLPGELKKKLHKITGESLSVIRCEKELSAAAEALDDLQKELGEVAFSDQDRAYNRQWREYLELRSMIPVAKAIVKSASIRKESRGVHIRSDYFKTDNENCLYNIVLQGSDLKETKVPAVLTRMKPETGCFAYPEYIEKIVESVE